MRLNLVSRNPAGQGTDPVLACTSCKFCPYDSRRQNVLLLSQFVLSTLTTLCSRSAVVISGVWGDSRPTHRCNNGCGEHHHCAEHLDYQHIQCCVITVRLFLDSVKKNKITASVIRVMRWAGSCVAPGNLTMPAMANMYAVILDGSIGRKKPKQTDKQKSGIRIFFEASKRCVLVHFVARPPNNASNGEHAYAVILDRWLRF